MSDPAPRRRFRFSLRTLLTAFFVLNLVFIYMLYERQYRIARPYEVTLIDANGKPVVGVSVKQYWQHYSLEEEGNVDRQNSNAKGQVRFPERRIRANLWRKLCGILKNISETGVHSSFGPSAHTVVLVPYEEVELVDESQEVGLTKQVYRIQSDASTLMQRGRRPPTTNNRPGSGSGSHE